MLNVILRIVKNVKKIVVPNVLKDIIYYKKMMNKKGMYVTLKIKS